MTLDEIHNEWEKDSHIDRTVLDVESLKTPTIQAKYMKYWSYERVSHQKLMAKLSLLKKEKFEFYSQGPSEEHLERGWEYPGGKILRTDLPVYMESDADLIKLNLQIALQQEKVNLLDQIVRSLNQRSFHIKNAIEFLRWTSGN